MSRAKKADRTKSPVNIISAKVFYHKSKAAKYHIIAMRSGGPVVGRFPSSYTSLISLPSRIKKHFGE